MAGDFTTYYDETNISTMDEGDFVLTAADTGEF